MIYESINELIEAIKEEECFKSYYDSLQVFKLPEVESLMREMNRLNEEKVARGYDMVVIARSAAKGKNYHDIESAFLHLGSLHGIIES